MGAGEPPGGTGGWASLLSPLPSFVSLSADTNALSAALPSHFDTDRSSSSAAAAILGHCSSVK